MAATGGFVSDNVKALVLFYLFERACAGFIKWGLDGCSPDGGFTNFLNEAIKSARDKVAAAVVDRGLVPVAASDDVFDTGLMPNSICEYLQGKIAKSAAVPLLAGTTPRLKPGRFREKVSALTQLRNKVMHGQQSSLPPGEIAAHLYDLFQDFRAIMSVRVGPDGNAPDTSLALVDLSLLTADGHHCHGINHTSWARLLFLTKEELLWVATGQNLPIDDGCWGAAATHGTPNNIDGAEFLHRQNILKIHLRRQETSFFRTMYIPWGATDPAVKSKLYSGDYRSIWVALEPTVVTQSASAIRSIASYLHETCGGQNARLRFAVDCVAEGPCDIGSDPMNIPWWRRAAPGACFIRIALK